MRRQVLRRSPIAAWHEAHASAWIELEGMPIPSRFSSQAGNAVVLEDLSWRRRVGCKGEAAADFLQSQGWPVPQAWNSWRVDADGVLVARVGMSEFLIEATGSDSTQVRTFSSQVLPARVYPVVRQDFTFALGGPRARELLSEVCALDVRPVIAYSGEQAGLLALTLMAGVSVMLMPRVTATGSEFTIWCDPSFAPYLWATLIAIARDLGGGAVAHRSTNDGYWKGGADGQSTSSRIL